MSQIRKRRSISPFTEEVEIWIILEFGQLRNVLLGGVRSQKFVLRSNGFSYIGAIYISENYIAIRIFWYKWLGTFRKG